MKTRKREKIGPIHVNPEDTIHLNYRQEIEFPDGHIIATEQTVLESRIGRKMTVNEAVIFDVESDDFEGATDGIGGALLVVPD